MGPFIVYQDGGQARYSRSRYDQHDRCRVMNTALTDREVAVQVDCIEQSTPGSEDRLDHLPPAQDVAELQSDTVTADQRLGRRAH